MSVAHFRSRNRRRLILSICALVSISLSGCAGLKFTNRPDYNVDLPQGLLGASVFTDTEILKRHLEEIPGIIVADKGSGNVVELAFLQPTGAKPSVSPIKDNSSFYHSVIDSNITAKGGYLQLLSANLTAKQTADVTIAETSESFISNQNVPVASLVAWSASHPPSSAIEKRYYVQGVLLSTVTKTVYSEVDKSATVQGGAAFGVNGNYYATDKATATSSFALIGAHLLDIDALAQGGVRNAPDPGHPNAFAVTKVFKSIVTQ